MGGLLEASTSHAPACFRAPKRHPSLATCPADDSPLPSLRSAMRCPLCLTVKRRPPLPSWSVVLLLLPACFPCTPHVLPCLTVVKRCSALLCLHCLRCPVHHPLRYDLLTAF